MWSCRRPAGVARSVPNRHLESPPFQLHSSPAHLATDRVTGLHVVVKLLHARLMDQTTWDGERVKVIRGPGPMKVLT